jgi:phytoene synthase
MKETKRGIFKNGSTTYFYSSLFFPREIWEKVATLYAYVRTADDLVDAVPQKNQAFAEFVKETKNIIALYVTAQKNTGSWINGRKVYANVVEKGEFGEIIQPFVELLFQHAIPTSWVVSFLRSMAADLTEGGSWIRYRSAAQTEAYIYGSAEVIGLMLCKLMNLPREAYSAAKMQGAAMQHINFIRDMHEDCELKRQYFSQEVLRTFAIDSLCEDVLSEGKYDAFKKFVSVEVAKFRAQQAQAEVGYRYIPYRYRVAITTAAQLYSWTADVIEQNPRVIFERKVKPSKLKVFTTMASVALSELIRRNNGKL